MATKIRITARKWNGDDEYSWAVFFDGRMVGGMNGLNKNQARYYVKMLREKEGVK